MNALPQTELARVRVYQRLIEKIYQRIYLNILLHTEIGIVNTELLRIGAKNAKILNTNVKLLFFAWVVIFLAEAQY